MKVSRSFATLTSATLLGALSFAVAASAHESKSADKPMAGHQDSSMKSHHGMMQGHGMKMPMSGNVDKDFAMMMTMHHQQAVAMVDVFIKDGKSPELKAMARKMKIDQQGEIKQMARFAGPMDHSKMKMADSMHRDHGKMTDAHFDKLDQNKDGSVSRAEFAKHHGM